MTWEAKNHLLPVKIFIANLQQWRKYCLMIGGTYKSLQTRYKYLGAGSYDYLTAIKLQNLTKLVNTKQNF